MSDIIYLADIRAREDQIFYARCELMNRVTGAVMDAWRDGMSREDIASELRCTAGWVLEDDEGSSAPASQQMKEMNSGKDNPW